MKKEETLHAPAAAARFIHKSEGSVRNYSDEGKLPCIRTSTGMRLYRQSDLEEFMRKQSEKKAGVLGLLASEAGALISPATAPKSPKESE